MLIDRNIMVSMRDGILLATDIYKPLGDSALPVLVARTPYNKDGFLSSNEIASFVDAGYIVTVQDVRGRFSSEGDFYPYIFEVDDALDFYEWLLKQPWCDGRLATFGGSYLGGTQTLPARKSHPAVKAMVPEITFDDQFGNCIYQGGAKVMHDLVWTVGSIIPEMLRRAGATAQLPSLIDALKEIPIANHSEIKKWGTYYHDWLTNSVACEYWDNVSPHTGYDGMKMPALNISGWYDIFLQSTLNNFTEMKKRNKDARLIMGPWTHMNYSGHFPELSFGDEGSATFIDLTKIKIDWFDRHVKGKDKPNGSPVKIFVMGFNKWRDEEDFPLPDTKYHSYYLQKDGKLSSEKIHSDTYDSFRYDPMNPVPTVGGGVILPGENSSGPRDQSMLDGRDDILTYCTDVLEKPVEVIGRISLNLVAESDCFDTDFTAKLIDVYPDGRAILLTDGILRARFYKSFREPTLLKPGEIYEFTIDVGGTANVFLSGHRIRLDISSSNFPKYNRNSNTGGEIARETAEMYKVANNKIYHTSRLVLPLIERE